MNGGPMKLVGRGLLLALLLGAIAFPALVFNVGSASPEPDITTIRSYEATYDVDADGTLRATERLEVEFPTFPERRGIFRYFDHADPNAPSQRRVPHDIRVTMDGGHVETLLQSEDKGRFTVVRVGSEYVTVDPGIHVYEISYRIDHALLPDGDTSNFYWNLIPGGWAQQIDSARLVVNLPGRTSQVRCAVGAGATTGCRAQGEGTDTLTVTAEGIEPYTPLTVKAGVDLAIDAPPVVRAWSPRWDRVLGGSWLGIVVTVLLAAGAAVLGAMAGRATQEEEPGFPLMYAPPEGIGPAQGTYLLNEKVGKNALVVTLMDMHEKGLVDLRHNQHGWAVSGTPSRARVAADPVMTGLARDLGVMGESGLFTVRGGSVSEGQTLQTATAGVKASTTQWARSAGMISTAGIGSFAGLLCLAGFALAVGLVILNPLSMTLAALVPGAFGIFALDTLRPGASTRRTPQARELWSRLGGFRRVLSTPSSEDRFDFASKQDTYLAYLPWAVAFGVADKWAAKYQYEMGVPPPQPTYFSSGGYVGPGSIGSSINSVVADFNHSVSSSISSYKATQSSSSGGGFSGGGGGGFSGGGGGGGGGGGSW